MLVSAWRVHVAPRWASVGVADVDTFGAAWITAMRPQCNARTVLPGFLADAVKAKRLAVNPRAPPTRADGQLARLKPYTARRGRGCAVSVRESYLLTLPHNMGAKYRVGWPFCSIWSDDPR